MINAVSRWPDELVRKLRVSHTVGSELISAEVEVVEIEKSWHFSPIIFVRLSFVFLHVSFDSDTAVSLMVKLMPQPNLQERKISRHRSSIRRDRLRRARRELVDYEEARFAESKDPKSLV